jgi:hypothetical protein
MQARPSSLELEVKKLYRSMVVALSLALCCDITIAAPGNEAVEEPNCEDHWSVIDSLTKDPSNLSLAEATVTAIETCADSESNAIAETGIAAASNLPEAEAVAAALREAGADQTVVDGAMQQYVKLMDQPFIHHDGTIPTGGGAYDPGPIIGGGTRPPIGGGTVPPVSPDA